MIKASFLLAPPLLSIFGQKKLSVGAKILTVLGDI